MSTHFTPWRVLHIELSESIPPLPRDPGIQGVYVVFWWNGIPLGSQSIPAPRLPIPASQLAEIALQTIAPAVGGHLLERGFRARLPIPPDHPPHDEDPPFDTLAALRHPLQELRERLLSTRGGFPPASVSVVVCTRDRPEPLARCLHSLRQLDPPPQEIVVVDNAPRSPAVRELLERTPGVRYVLEPRPGLSVARNTGIRESAGELIAFTDDDVVIDPGWIARLRRGFEDPNVMAVTGLVLPAELETEAQFLFQHGDSGFGWGFRPLIYDARFFEQMKRRGVPVWHIGAGANMAFRREAFRRVGMFDERLGAGASGCSEDSEIWYRVLAEGWLCRYEPTAVAHHHHRSDMEGLKHQMHQYMRGHVAALLIQWEKYRHAGNLYRAFGLLPAYYARLLLRRLRRRGSRASDRTLGAQIAGCAAGVSFYLRNRHSADAFRAPAPS